MPPINRKRIYIGIDPDVDKSGVAVWDRISEKLEVFTMKFFDLYKFLSNLEGKDCVKVIIEAGWLNKKSNFRQGYVKNGKFVQISKIQGEKIANKVGRNAETGRKIVEMCKELEIEYQLVQPKKSKTPPSLFKSLTGIDTRNQEKIDAAMLVFKL